MLSRKQLEQNLQNETVRIVTRRVTNRQGQKTNINIEGHTNTPDKTVNLNDTIDWIA